MYNFMRKEIALDLLIEHSPTARDKRERTLINVLGEGSD